MKLSRALPLAAAALLVSCSTADTQPVAAPTFSPAGGYNFGAPLAVTLATPTPAAAIHYTTDGSAPSALSPRYTAPIPVAGATTTIHAIAMMGAYASDVASETYTYRAVGLAVDDGTVTAGVAYGSGPFLTLNRFTPAPEDFPFRLRTISILFVSASEAAPVRLVVFTDDDGNPASGATLRTVQDATVQIADWSTWSVYELDDPVVLEGPGDVLVGAIVPAMTFIGMDQTAPAGRSWFGDWGGAEPPDPPVLPTTGRFSTVEDWFTTGNWTIRASN